MKIYRAVSSAFTLLLVVAACQDRPGPTDATLMANPIAMSASPAGDDGARIEPHMLMQKYSAPALESYDVSFWVSNERGNGVTVNYLPEGWFWGRGPKASRGGHRSNRRGRDDDDESRVFASLYIPEGAIRLLPDGGPLSPGDSVLITVSIHRRLLVLTMEPSGLVFNEGRPAELYVSYAAARRDYDRDGDEDDDDASVEQNYLGLWVREGAGSPWFPVTDDQSVTEKWFKGYLRHFSDHAVSW